ncbi:MAG: hypothetical protein A2W25_14415 [candidate division Zixibacteria bacterium RBG_16_53_22]|nr:MAG: hypothetical protein A2W25_14415 [candidate division Zixibacteria bacterium RBG_16_53_22]
MRKVLIIAGIVVLVVIGALIAIPLIFKPQIVRMVKEKANQSINANLDFKGVGISLIRNFPNASLTIDDLVIVNREPFAGDTLAQIRKFELSLNLSKLLFKRKVEVLSLTIDEPRIYAMVLDNGQANYMIIPEADESRPTETDTAAAMELAIEGYRIKNGSLAYINDSTKMILHVAGLNHEGSGDFSRQTFTLYTRTNIDEIDFSMKGVPYLNDANLQMKADLQMDMAQNRFAFKENEIRLNDLALKFDGWIQLADDKTELDMTFNAPSTEFKSILSMVPAIYRRDFGNLRAEGRMNLEGIIKGVYGKTQFPMVDIKLFVDNGTFQHPDLPTPVKNVALDFQVTNPGVTVNETVIDLRRLHLEIGDQPIDAQLLVRNPVKDPYVDGLLKGRIDLGQVGKFMPLGDTIKLDGTIQSDLTFRGTVSSVQEQRYDNITANGSVALSNINYSAPSIPQPVIIPAANISFTPQQARLERFDMQFGRSDIHANGGLTNMIGYILGGQTLNGTLTLTSGYLDLNPFLQQESGAIAAVELPARVDFVMSGRFEQIVVSNFNLTNVQGQLILRDRKLMLIDLKANFLEGEMVSNGAYTYVKPGNPHVDFDLKLSKLSIPAMYKNIVTVQAFAPVASFMKGSVSGDLQLDSDLGDSLKPIWQTISSKGALQIPEARVEGFEPLKKIGEALKYERLKNPGFSNFMPSFDIAKGVFSLNPTTLKIEGYEAILSGSNSLDKTINYLMKLNLPASAVKENINTALAGLIKQDVNTLTDETVVIDVGLTGTFSDPKVQTSLAQIAKGAGDQLKRAAQAEAQRRREELEQQAREKVAGQKEALQDTVKKAIEERTKGQAEDIKNRIKGLFGK